MRLDDAVRLIRGKKGTNVYLTVKKIDGTIKEIKIERDKIIIEETYTRSVITSYSIHYTKLYDEATGYGVVYFAQEMLATKGESLEGKVVAVSGFGNVAWGAAKKATELGAKVITISGPDGYIYDEEGLNEEKIEYMLELRASNQDIVAPYADEFGAKFFAGKKPWEQKVDIARNNFV